MKKILNFLKSDDTFLEDEWLLKHQISVMLTMSFIFSLGLLPFSYVRLSEGNTIVGVSQLLFSIFLIISFFTLKRDKGFYRFYSKLFLILFFLYTAIIFFYVPQNSLNILWVIAAPILIFFFLNRQGGKIMFILVACFIVLLLIIDYPYSLAEYITLIGAFLVTTFIMNSYESVKDAEEKRLISYNKTLQVEIEKQTSSLNKLNKKLQENIKEELDKRLVQEQMLLRQCRMASMGEMLECIAHQWRQPLMNINAVLMNIDRGIETNKGAKYLEEKILEISTLTSHMSQTIEDFRHLFTHQQQKMNFSIQGLIDEVLKLMKNNLKRVDVNISASRDIVLNNYKNELTQVFITLLSNSIEALENNNIAEKKIAINFFQSQSKVYIEIEDNGGGISQNIITKIFDPYFTTKKQTGGTGLGLYIAKIIVEQNLQGSLKVSNMLNGAKFTISLAK